MRNSYLSYTPRTKLQLKADEVTAKLDRVATDADIGVTVRYLLSEISNGNTTDLRGFLQSLSNQIHSGHRAPDPRLDARPPVR